jgi:trimeric autotransporter adhesin
MHRPSRMVALLAVLSVTLLAPAAAQAHTVPAPALAWSPTTSSGGYDYGTLAAGTKSSETFTLTNSGGSASAELTVTLSGTVFTKTADRCTGTSLGPGKSCTVTVQFHPASATSYTATLTATSHRHGVTAPLALTGTGPVAAVVSDPGGRWVTRKAQDPPHSQLRSQWSGSV